MSNFNDTVKQDTPRLVVAYKCDDGKVEQFQWGVVGAIPLMSLIGCIHHVQTKLASGEWVMECPQPALVIAWDDENRDFEVFVSPDIPAYSIVGMLEGIKNALIETQRARQATAQQVEILGPDGRPVRRRG